MTIRQKLLPVILIQVIPLLIFPINFLVSGLPFVALLVLLYIGLIYALLKRGRTWAHSLSIFLQGLNIIVRVMMLFPNAVGADGQFNIPYILTNIVAILLSGWILLRLDQPDVRSILVA
jgi:hypothetical protein